MSANENRNSLSIHLYISYREGAVERPGDVEAELAGGLLLLATWGRRGGVRGRGRRRVDCLVTRPAGPTGGGTGRGEDARGAVRRDGGLAAATLLHKRRRGGGRVREGGVSRGEELGGIRSWTFLSVCVNMCVYVSLIYGRLVVVSSYLGDLEPLCAGADVGADLLLDHARLAHHLLDQGKGMKRQICVVREQSLNITTPHLVRLQPQTDSGYISCMY